MERKHLTAYFSCFIEISRQQVCFSDDFSLTRNVIKIVLSTY